MIQLVKVLWMTYRGYKAAELNSVPVYAALVNGNTGMPQVAVFIATGREAWRISQKAIKEFQ